MQSVKDKIQLICGKISAFFKREIQECAKFCKDKETAKQKIVESFSCSRYECLECGKELFSDEIFCEECSTLFPVLSGNVCPKCGRFCIGNGSCYICKTTQHSFDRAFSAFDYNGMIAKHILNMKMYGKAYLAKPLAQYLAYVYMANNIEADLVTFVPMTQTAIKERGYNQSELLAKEFSHLTGLPLFDGVIKKKETLFQKRLSAEDRRKNMKGVFAVKGDVKGKKIILIDDVMTTCATVDSVAKALKLKNSSKIYAITIASTGEKIAK